MLLLGVLFGASSTRFEGNFCLVNFRANDNFRELFTYE